MNRLMKFFIVLLFACTSIAGNAQSSKDKKGDPEYRTAIGMKFYPTGITLKTFMGPKKKNAFELIGYFKDGFRLTGLYEFYNALNSAGNLKWYVGFGAHLGFEDGNNGSDVKGGVDGVLGLDYKFMKLPLNISLDWQPALGFGDDDAFTPWGGIGVRFAF